jgi:hypothetical protein
MRDRVLAALLTLAVFAAGFGSGLWAERHRPLPRPPGAFMGEFGAKPGIPGGQAPMPVNRAELREQIDKLGPAMDGFRAHVNDIYAQFDRDMDGILTPEQKDIYAKKYKGHHGFTPPSEAETVDKPLSDDQIDQLMQRPLRTLAYLVIVPMTLERMTNDMKLDEAQSGKVKDLLHVRREKFMELVDSSPPLSMTLSRLAPLAQRLGVPAKAADAPAR